MFCFIDVFLTFLSCNVNASSPQIGYEFDIFIQFVCYCKARTVNFPVKPKIY